MLVLFLFMGWDAGEGSGKPMPVCSDLDLLLIAGHGEVQFPPLPRPQEELRKWCANHCASIVPHVDRNNVASSFRCLWGNMLQSLPPDEDPGSPVGLGAGDQLTLQFVQSLVKATKATGAIRHSAENFNYHCPQVLEDKALIWVDQHHWTRLDVEELLVKLEAFTFQEHPLLKQRRTALRPTPISLGTRTSEARGNPKVGDRRPRYLLKETRRLVIGPPGIYCILVA